MKTTKLFALLSFGLWISNVSHAQQKPDTLAHSVLWSVVHPKMPADTSYIFGTMHVISARDFSITDKVFEAMQKCNVFITEVDLTNPDLQKQLAEGMKMKNGVTLDKLLKKKDYELIKSFMLESSGKKLDSYNELQPYYLGAELQNYFIDGTPVSYEMNLLQIAKANKMEVRGLEPVSNQLMIIDSIPYEDQAKEVLHMVKNEKDTRKEFKEMVKAYKSEDLNKLDSLVQAGFASDRTRDILLSNRNALWTFYLSGTLRGQKAFVAVGAGHLPGPGGLIALLRGLGFEVEPVFANPEE